jgi:hypothetical protein
LAKISGVIGKVQKSARLAAQFALDRNFATAGDNHRFISIRADRNNPVIPLLEAA